VGNVLDDMTVRAAGVLAEKGHWMWMFQAATEELTSWRDPHGDYWVVDPINGYIYMGVGNLEREVPGAPQTAEPVQREKPLHGRKELEFGYSSGDQR
jgi:hypothetical protein